MDILWDGEEYYLLTTLFPILLDTSVRTSCPEATCLVRIYVARYSVQDIIGHLNDVHRWPRCESDRNEHNQHLPTISGWLKEEAEKNGWDLTCRPLSK